MTDDSSGVRPAEAAGGPLPAAVSLPIRGPGHVPLDPALARGFQEVSSASASSILYALGIRNPAFTGVQPLLADTKIIGSALTLQFMPYREDVVQAVAAARGLSEEFAATRSALWSVFEAVQPGDVLVVQAFGDRSTGCVGEMLVGHHMQQGGAGVVVDGCVRDVPILREQGFPVWSVGATPNSATQGSLFPWAFDVPIACGGTLVLPGDVIVADEDGAVVIPLQLAPLVAERARHHEAWEEFSRLRIAEGGSLSRYYPLVDESAWSEYEEWRAAQSGGRDGGISA